MDYQELLAQLEELEQNHQIEKRERVIQIQELLRKCNQLFATAETLDHLVMDATILERIARLLAKVIDET